MKRLLVLLCALFTTAACSTPPNTNTSTPPATITSGTLSEADLIAKEKESWTALEKKDFTAFGTLLDDDYVEVGDTGFFDKAGVLEFVKDLEISNPDFSNWKILPAGKDVMVVTYDVSAKTSYKGEKVPDGPYRASGAWVKRDGKWLGIYFQETLADNAPPPPTDEAVGSNELPSKTLAETGDDGIANEKLIWDALKRKDYAGFATYLDEAQLEVAANGVNTKAESVKDVRSYDFSKFEQSNFKALPLGPEAMLVTYEVKSPDPKVPLERAATVWVKREGKWRALFHQGTPEKKRSTTATPQKKPSQAN